jgi:hypothetical protein
MFSVIFCFNVVVCYAGASIFLISLHAAFYNFDALDVPEDQVGILLFILSFY